MSVARTQDVAAGFEKVGRDYTTLSSRVGEAEQATDALSGVGGIIKAGPGAMGNVGAFVPGENQTVVAMGYGALEQATEARKTVAIGVGAGQNSGKSRDNVFVGENAGKNTTAKTSLYDQAQRQGTRNIFIGGNAGLFNQHGFNLVGIGRNTASCVAPADSNDQNGIAAVGGNALAGYAPIGLTGDIENWSPLTGTGHLISAFGSQALSAFSGQHGDAFGAQALLNAKRANQCVAVGAQALSSLESEVWYNGGAITTVNIAGTYSQSANTVTLSIAGHGASAGDIVLFRLLDGASQTFQSDIIPAPVVSVLGANSLTIAHPISRTAFGAAHLYSRVSAAPASIDRDNNTAVGYRAGAVARTFRDGTFLGTWAATNATSGNASTAVGGRALTGFSSLTSCTAIGYDAGRFDVTGTLQSGAAHNRTILGSNAPTSGDNQVQLGSSGTTPYAYAALQVRSDERDKADVEPTALGLDFINRIQPVQYRWDMRDDYVADIPEDDRAEWWSNPVKDGSKKRSRLHQGVIAQQVRAVCEEMGVDFSGLQDHAIAGGNDVLTVGYDHFVPVLIRAVQELAARVEQLEAQA